MGKESPLRILICSVNIMMDDTQQVVTSDQTADAFVISGWGGCLSAMMAPLLGEERHLGKLLSEPYYLCRRNKYRF